MRSGRPGRCSRRRWTKRSGGGEGVRVAEHPGFGHHHQFDQGRRFRRRSAGPGRRTPVRQSAPGAAPRSSRRSRTARSAAASLTSSPRQRAAPARGRQCGARSCALAFSAAASREQQARARRAPAVVQVPPAAACRPALTARRGTARRSMPGSASVCVGDGLRRRSRVRPAGPEAARCRRRPVIDQHDAGVEPQLLGARMPARRERSITGTGSPCRSSRPAHEGGRQRQLLQRHHRQHAQPPPRRGRP